MQGKCQGVFRAGEAHHERPYFIVNLTKQGWTSLPDHVRFSWNTINGMELNQIDQEKDGGGSWASR